MTEDRDPIQQYLDQLRLSLRIPEVGRILVEAEDHLRAATAAKVAEGMSEERAQRDAVAAFGPVHEIVYAHQTRHGRAAAMLADLAISAWRVIAWYLIAAFALDLAGLSTQPHPMTCSSQNPCPTVLFSGPTTTAAGIAEWAAIGAAGLALLALYYGIRHFHRHRGRVWSIPLGGFFPLAAAITSMAAVVGAILTITTTHIEHAALLGAVAFLALGMGITYGWRMGRMLRQQERDHELA
jgi:hypothetical protein